MTSPANHYAEISTRITAAEREYRRLADQAWSDHDYLRAIRHRGQADGLEHARDLILTVLAEARAASNTTQEEA